jgi:iron complex transport system permease protein
VFEAFYAFDGSREHIVVTAVRAPRVLAAILVGAALAVAGAIMQAITNNPLASPGLLGINSGAAFAVVIAMSVSGTSASSAYLWWAFAGAAMAGVVVYGLGSLGAGGPTPLKLALAGTVISTFLASLTTAILIFNQNTLDAVRLWSVGSLAGRQMSNIAAVLPYIIAGLCFALLFARQIMTLSLGQEVARALGQNVMLWLVLAGVVVVLLAGSAVALAGPIGFVGLVVPHIARFLVGVDYRRIIPYCAVIGPLLVVAADGLLRNLLGITDMPVGITMAVIGAPFFIYLARKQTSGAKWVG